MKEEKENHSNSCYWNENKFNWKKAMKCVLFRLLSSAFACNRALFRHFYRFGLMSIFTTVDFARTRRELKYFVTSNGSYHIQINRIVRFHVSWRTDRRIEQPSTRSALHAKWIYPKTQKKYVNRFSLSHFRFVLYKLTLSFWTQWEEKVKNHIGIVHLSVSIKTHTHTLQHDLYVIYRKYSIWSNQV